MSPDPQADFKRPPNPSYLKDTEQEHLSTQDLDMGKQFPQSGRAGGEGKHFGEKTSEWLVRLLAVRR